MDCLYYILCKGAGLGMYPPTQDHVAATAGPKIYIIGGMQLSSDPGKKDLHLLNDVFVFDTEKMKGKLQKATLKQPDIGTGMFGSGCAVVRQIVYLFGGGLKVTDDPDKPRYSNELFGLYTSAMTWFDVIVDGEKPTCRSGHAMCSINNQIVLFGGYGPHFAKRRFVWKQRPDGGSGWNNELAVFDLKNDDKGTWKWPVDGQQENWPSPRTGHTLTPTKDKQIVLYGGRNWTGTLNDLHILSAENWTWTRVTGRGDHPMPRVCFHSANYVEGKSGMGLLLILGGKDSGNDAARGETVTEDTIISLDTGVTSPLTPNPGIARSSHTVSQVSTSDKSVALYVHGGLDQEGQTTNKSIIFQWHYESLASLQPIDSLTPIIPLKNDQNSYDFLQNIVTECLKIIKSGEGRDAQQRKEQSEETTDAMNSINNADCKDEGQ